MAHCFTIGRQPSCQNLIKEFYGNKDVWKRCSLTLSDEISIKHITVKSFQSDPCLTSPVNASNNTKFGHKYCYH